MLGSTISMSGPNKLASSSVADVLDDITLSLGDGLDQVLLNRSTILNANTALAGVMIGTPVTPAVAANTLLVSNVTASGDMLFAVNTGGHSQGLLFLDGSAGTLNFPLGATSGGNINIGANLIKTTNHAIKEEDNVYLAIRNAADSTYTSIKTGGIQVTGVGLIGGSGVASLVRTWNGDNEFGIFQARDNGVGLVEVARLQSAADPYFMVGRNDTGMSTSAVTDVLRIQGGAGGAVSAGFGVGIPFYLGNDQAAEVETRASIDVTMATVTNGAEDANMIFSLMDGGAAPAAVMTLTGADKKVTCAAGLGVTGTLDTGHIQIASTTGSFYAGAGSTGDKVVVQATDTGVGWVEIAGFVGAADPYTRIGRDDTGVALDAVTDMLVLQAGGGAGNEAANFGLGVAFNVGNAASEVEKRGAINLVIETATDGSEDTEMHMWTMAGGSLNQAFKIGSNGELYADLDGDSGSYLTNGVNLFDEFDDVKELRRFQLSVPGTGLVTEEERQANRQRLQELGVVEEKTEGEGYHMKMQSMTRLLAGGIYQNRQIIDTMMEKLERIERLVAA